MALSIDMAGIFRAEQLDRERRAASDMVRAYGDVWQHIRSDVANLGAKMAAARKQGEVVSPAWLYKEDRLNTLQKQTEMRINVFAKYAENSVTALQREAVEAAKVNAQKLTLLSIGQPNTRIGATFNQVPTAATDHLIGTLKNGQPLSDLFDTFGPEASAALKKALIVGIATGQGITVIDRTLRKEMGGSLVRALKISRTEVLNSYRAASIESYKANSDVVAGWVWIADLSGSTCPVCISMNGTFHELSEQMDSHVNCRCSCAPETKSWKELGLDGIEDTAVEIESGEEWFAKQSPEIQEQVLGKAGYKAFIEKKVTLKDFVGVKTSENWGRERYTKSLKDATAKRLK